MDYSRWTIDGRTFRTISDYEAGLRDHEKIKAIRGKTDLKDPKALAELYILLQSGELKFETILGRDFDDEIYELKELYKKNGITGGREQKQKTGLFRKQRAGKTQEAAKAAVSPKKPGALKAAKNKSRDSGKQEAARQRKAAARQDKAAARTGRKSSRQASNKAKKEKQTLLRQEKQLQRSHINLSGYDEEMRREILRQLARQEKRRKIIVACCSIVAVLSFGYFGIYNYYYARTESNARELADLKNRGGRMNITGTVHKTGDGDTPDILEEYQLPYIKNKSLIGWIVIADTKIDYPVMQTTNAEYYLTHNFNQEVDKNGSIFLDPLCDVLKPSTNLIVYGHHMKSGSMFGGLDKYSKKDYYEKHKIIQFDSIYEKGKYEVMYVFRSRIYYEDEITFKYYQFINANSEAEFNSAMEAMAEMSLYDTGVTAAYGDSLLTLSTCDNSEEDGRFVVVAKRIE